jgi:peptidoglycan glycosyltransferase
VNRQIKLLGVGLLACYLALFAMLNWIQVIKADDYNNDPLNTAKVRQQFNRDRGTITSADGALLAISVDNPDTTSQFERVREYPERELFAQVTGRFSFWYGSTGVELTYGDELSGQTFGQQARGFADLFVDQQNVGNVSVSVRKDLQEVARDALGEREGSVVAIDVKTGELLSFWSYPSYDPNLLATLDRDAAEVSWALLNLAEGNPLLAHQYQDRYFPGSTFKVVTGSTGLQTGKVTPEQPRYPIERSYTPPQTNTPIFNFGGTQCGGALFNILRISCNTSFARMGVETLGPSDMITGSESFGFNNAPPIDLPGPAKSVFPTNFANDLPKLAQSSIGQNDVQASPLQMALVAAAVANQGRIMKPHVMTEIRDTDQDIVDRYEPSVWKEPLTPELAETMRQAMIGVVEEGTARTVRIPGFEVGAKTGTAQLGTEPPQSHLWMIAFGGPPGDPQVAVAVVVLNQPGLRDDATGGQVAGPIVRRVLDAALRVRNGG